MVQQVCSLIKRVLNSSVCRKREKNGGIKEKERADLRYKKASFQVLETFVCSLLLRSCAIIKARDWFFNTQPPPPPPPPSLSLLFFLFFFSHSLLFSPRMRLCQRWKALYLLQPLWCLNDDVKSESRSQILPPPPLLLLSLFRFQQLHLAFPISPLADKDATEKTHLKRRQKNAAGMEKLVPRIKGFITVSAVFYLDSMKPCCLFNVSLSCGFRSRAD